MTDSNSKNKNTNKKVNKNINDKNIVNIKK